MELFKKLVAQVVEYPTIAAIAGFVSAQALLLTILSGLGFTILRKGEYCERGQCWSRDGRCFSPSPKSWCIDSHDATEECNGRLSEVEQSFKAKLAIANDGLTVANAERDKWKGLYDECPKGSPPPLPRCGPINQNTRTVNVKWACDPANKAAMLIMDRCSGRQYGYLCKGGDGSEQRPLPVSEDLTCAIEVDKDYSGHYSGWIDVDGRRCFNVPDSNPGRATGKTYSGLEMTGKEVYRVKGRSVRLEP